MKCLYCQNTPNPEVQPINISIDIDALKSFIKRDPEPIICFYGGDPLYNVSALTMIMDEVPAKRFIIQTNGLLLDKLEDKYVARIDALLVSIDGRRETTDYYRGVGIYDKILDNLRRFIERGFRGEVIARMAVSGCSDVYEDVIHLLNLDNPKFDYVHWQLDALWDYPPASRYDDFDIWVESSYNPGISRLIRYWVGYLEEGIILGIVPFLGIMWSLISGERRGYLRCGAGIDAFGITTDGMILACPIAPEYRFNILGDIYTTDPKDLPNKIRVDEPCISCEYYEICGGRCLFANKTMLWGLSGFKKVCKTVKHLIDELRVVKYKVEELLERGILDLDKLKYPRYINSLEIIP